MAIAAKKYTAKSSKKHNAPAPLIRSYLVWFCLPGLAKTATTSITNAESAPFQDEYMCVEAADTKTSPPCPSAN